jgi:hypothetical protein
MLIIYADADYNCNWLGGEAVSKEIGAPGFENAGKEHLSRTTRFTSLITIAQAIRM